jgi:hypothetical protein
MYWVRTPPLAPSVNKYRRSPTANPQTIFARFKSEVVSMCRDREKRARPTITNKIDKLKRKLDSVNNDPLNSEENKMLSSMEIKTEILELERTLFESCKVYAKAKHHVHAETICRDWVRSNRARKPRDTLFSLLNPLDDNPSPTCDSREMARLAREYHEELQGKDRDPTLEPDPMGLGEILDNVTARATPPQRRELAKFLSINDVHTALRNSGSDKHWGQGVMY